LEIEGLGDGPLAGARGVARGRVPKKMKLPPQVASLREIGKLTSLNPTAHPELFSKMKYFYTHIPKGQAALSTSKGFWQKYYEKYFVKDSLMPIVHLLGLMIPVGYYFTYFKGGHCKLKTLTL
jgi:hypothetical protein